MKIKEFLELNRSKYFYPFGPVVEELPNGKFKWIGELWAISDKVLDTEVQIVGETEARVDNSKRYTDKS